MKHFVILIVSVVVLWAFFCSQSCADVTLPTLFSDRMVLQRGMRVPIWGSADDEKVTVEFRDQTVETGVVDGQWILYLESMEAGGPDEMTITGSNSAALTFTDVQVGEVWVCSGQSNMVWKLIDSDGAEEAIADSGNHNIRLFILPGTSGPEEATWEICDANTSPNSYAVAFYFARELAMNLNVPVGLIEAAKGATGIHHWTTLRDGILYEKKIAPLQPYGIRGAIWYQGEWDAQSEATAQLYYEVFPGLIDEWRYDWGQGDFPFLYVQLPSFETGNRIPGWMIVRDAQLATLSVPNTAMACTIDLPVVPVTNIHPTCKEPVGYRLALGARALAYDENIVYSGPIFDPNKFYIDANVAVVGFDHVADGLQMVGDELTGFEIAGADGNFVDANASIDDENDRVVVWSNFATEPTSVRYGWDDFPACNLFNSEFLPASPFTSDEWSYPPRNRYAEDEE